MDQPRIGRQGMPPRARPARGAALLALALLAGAAPAVDYDQPPISYSTAPVDDAVARLARSLDAGGATLPYDQRFGYLPGLLAALGIPTASQVLVFSKTSLQNERIEPGAPRALYFNDEVYVGSVQGGELLEIAATDPRQGTVFYTLGQHEQARPRLARQTHECLQCHDSRAFTGGVPGLVMRSVYPDADGRPILTAGTHVTDQRSPWPLRWGGWYVTGSHGAMRHLGNLVTDQDAAPDGVDREPGANLGDLGARIDQRAYLGLGSDVVALMVLGHQTQMHNLITRAGFETRVALASDTEINIALERPAGHRSETTLRRIAAVGDELVRYLLFSGEAALSEPVRGSAEFARGFAAAGPRDARGRSLRDLDLTTRLLRHPCSHLIYSAAFDQLPAEMLAHIYGRLWTILAGDDRDPAFAHLSAADRVAIREILLETKPGFAQAKPPAP